MQTHAPQTCYIHACYAWNQTVEPSRHVLLGIFVYTRPHPCYLIPWHSKQWPLGHDMLVACTYTGVWLRISTAGEVRCHRSRWVLGIWTSANSTRFLIICAMTEIDTMTAIATTSTAYSFIHIEPNIFFFYKGYTNLEHSFPEWLANTFTQFTHLISGGTEL